MFIILNQGNKTCEVGVDYFTGTPTLVTLVLQCGDSPHDSD